MDAKNLLDLLLNCSPDIFFIPAHIWTPWFSALGANSGFDSIKECYEDLSDNIYAVETGLSSDPPMNWTCSFLDKYTLVSNSDAHSPEKLGRNANILDTEISYKDITEALKKGNPDQCLGTIEMYPQEGKYHYAGHEKCGICWDPVETNQHKGICTVCGRKVTNGVMNRVNQIADRKNGTDRKNRLDFQYAIPLKEILSEILGVGENSKQLTNAYFHLLSKLGPELNILLDMPIQEIQNNGNEILAQAIGRMRNGNVFIKHGFDGQYGEIKVFEEHEIKAFGKTRIISDNIPDTKPLKSAKQKTETSLKNMAAYFEKDTDKTKIQQTKEPEPIYKEKEETPTDQKSANTEQQTAIEHFEGPAIVMAGPGTGKTFILINRIVNLIKNKNVNPENIVAVTFTNRAANEMKHRIAKLINDTNISDKIHISTFHAFGLSVLKENFKLARRRKNFSVIDEKEKLSVIKTITSFDNKRAEEISKAISDIKQNQTEVDINIVDIIKKYEAVLIENNCFDIDDLIFYPLRIFEASDAVLEQYRQMYSWILIDEYQDINLIQYLLVKKLMSSSESNLFAIGDANQAIYGFRGADVKFIKQFVIDNPTAIIYHLKQSYRCTDRILKASQSIISENPKLKTQNPLTGLNEGFNINIIKTTSDKSEAEFIARTIEKMMGGVRFFSIDSGISQGKRNDENFSFSDFAILCRTNSQFKLIEKALINHGIPFQPIGDIPFFKQEPLNIIIDFLKYAFLPENILIKNRLINNKKIQPEDNNPDLTKLKELSVRKALEYIIGLYFRNEKSKDEKLIKKLLELSDDFDKDFNSFIEYTTLGIAPDAYRNDIDYVSLLSLHASKGLEFKCVFIAGCEDGLIPYSIFENKISNPEEERRLLYVGMTRAKTHLFLSHAEHRFLFGKELNLPLSPFINDIKSELIDKLSPDKSKKTKKDESQLKLF